MTRSDSWEDNFVVFVPEKLTAAEAKVLRDLICENPEGFLAALDAYVELSDDEPEEGGAEG